MFAESLIIHEQVDDVSVAVHRVHPTGEFLRCERPLFPVARRKTKGDVIGKAVILEQGLYLRRIRSAVDEVRTSPAKQVVGALRKYRLITNPFDEFRQLIVIHQLRVAEHLVRDPQKLLHLRAVKLHLTHKLILGIEESKRVMIGLVEDLYPSS